MKRSEQNTEGMQKVADLVEDIGVGMLTWADDSGTLTSRPMVPQEMDADGALWFFARLSSHRLAAQGKVNLAFARPDQATYVSISGRADWVENREKIESLWTDRAQPWFPAGPQDPDLSLLRVDVDDAEFWDVDSSQMVRMGMPRAAAMGGEPVGLGDTGKVANPKFPAALV